MPSESSSLTVTPNKKSGKMMIGMRGGSAAEEETEKNEKEDVNINGAGNNPRAPTSSPCDINDGSPFRKRLSIPPSNRLMPSQPAAFGYSPKKGARSWSLMRESTPELAIKQKGSVENMSRKLENMHLGSEEK